MGVCCKPSLYKRFQAIPLGNNPKQEFTMKTILLVGPESCGKTTTMNLVYDKIKSQAEVLEPQMRVLWHFTSFFRG